MLNGVSFELFLFHLIFSMSQYQCETTKGRIEIELHPEWSPKGAKRFEELVAGGFFVDVPLFRCVKNFLCQFGYKELRPHEHHWSNIEDDVPNETTPRTFKQGYISFAGGGQNTRSSHLFVTLGKHVSSLGREVWETPIGYVTEQSFNEVVSRWETKYGDMPMFGGHSPDPGKMSQRGGAQYVKNDFPDLDYILSCSKTTHDEPATNSVVRFDLEPDLGPVVIEFFPKWAPKGYKRMMELIRANWFDQARFFRVVPGFVVQFGMPANAHRAHEFGKITDDPVLESNTRGTISFATSGPNTRSFQLFINLGDNSGLNGQGFAPIGRVISGMEYVDRINSEYREQPQQPMITARGNEYLIQQFPRLSYIKSTSEDKPQEKEALLHRMEEKQRVAAPDQVQYLEQAQLGGATKGSFELNYSIFMVILLVLFSISVVRICFGTRRTDSLNGSRSY